jgi:hypothetical protein
MSATVPEGGEDGHLALGHLTGESAGRGQPVDAGHLDIEQGHVGAVLPGRGDDLVAPADIGDHLEVGPLRTGVAQLLVAHRGLVVAPAIAAPTGRSRRNRSKPSG